MMKRYIHLITFFIYTTLFVCSSASPKITFDEHNAYDYLKKQCEFGPRNPNSTGHKTCMNFLINEMKKFTKDVNIQKFSHFDQKKQKTLHLSNIIGTFSSANRNTPRIILCAHWDTRPMADRDKDEKNRNKPILGANDGASGVAALLEISRIMSNNPPPVTIDIVFFDGEDYGNFEEDGNLEQYFLGSRYFSKNLPFKNYKCAILLDMIGDKNLQIQREGFSNQYFPNLVDDIWNRASKLGISQFNNRVNGNIWDDHYILIKAGIPAIDIIDFDYKYWHTIEDTPDKCSPQSLKAVGDVIIDYIYN